MKKGIFFTLIIVTVCLFSSCNRSWVCECNTGSGVAPIELDKMSKNDAKDQCEKYALNQYALTGGCQLK